MVKAILIADDNPYVRRVLRDRLTKRNLPICGEAIDGLDAVGKALELEPDLILLDLSMPKMNGVEVASVLQGRLPSTRIILFTMCSEAPSLKPIMSTMGIDLVICKPEGLNGIEDRIEGLLSAGARRDDLAN